MGVPSTQSVELERNVEVKSPCNGICTLDIQDVCRGCKRTEKEISKWFVMSNPEKQQIIDRISNEI